MWLELQLRVQGRLSPEYKSSGTCLFPVGTRIACRPGFWYPEDVEYLAIPVLLFMVNGLVHYRLLTSRPVTWWWLLFLSAMDVALTTFGVVIGGGFTSFIFLAYYPALAAHAGIDLSNSLTDLPTKRRFPRQTRAIGHTFEFTFSLPEPSNTGGRRPVNRKKPAGKTPQKATPKTRKSKPLAKPDPVQVEAKSRHAERTARREHRPRSGRNYTDASPMQDGRKPLNSDSAWSATNLPSRTRPDAASAPRGIG